MAGGSDGLIAGAQMIMPRAKPNWPKPLPNWLDDLCASTSLGTCRERKKAASAAFLLLGVLMKVGSGGRRSGLGQPACKKMILK